MALRNSCNEVQSFGIWQGAGKAREFRIPSREDFPAFLKESVKKAIDYKQAHRLNDTRKRLLANLRSAGLRPPSQAALFDEDNTIGLIGEIIVEQCCRHRNFEFLWVKWTISGTSKSPGIDLVAKMRCRSEWDLHLVESKHIHGAAKGSDHLRCCAEIRGRFRNGLDEFDHDLTLNNLSGVALHMRRMIELARAAGENTQRMESSLGFLLSKLKQDDYSVEVVAAIDSRYCNDSTLKDSVRDVLLPGVVAAKRTDLVLLSYDLLEQTSDEILK